MGRAWRWWCVWVVVGVCLIGAGRAVAECKDEAAKGRVSATDAKGQDWTWKDADGCVRTRAELDAILRLHKLWWMSADHKEGQQAVLSGAKLRKAKLSGVDLSGVDLSEANLARADLTGAILYKADLSGAYFDKADLSGVSYESEGRPDVEYIAYAVGLDRQRYSYSPAALVALRKSFMDAGFVLQARQVTASILRHDQSWPQRILFDWTCAWGSDWRRPLVWLLLLCLVCGPAYWVGMHFGRVGGIYQIVLDKVVATKAAAEVVTRVETRVRWVGWERLRTRSVGGTVRGRSPKLRRRLVGMALRAEWRALRLAFLFSVLSALDIGFHEFNVGVWARMLLARDFNLKARGWMRVAGGVQSLVGLGLVALSLLSYFGHPFD